MQMFVRRQNGKIVNLEVEPSDSIDNVKQKIYDREGIAPNLQELLFVGQVLDDGNTLSDYDVTKEATLDLIPTAGIVTYASLWAVAPDLAGAQVAYLARGRTFAQTVAGVIGGQSYDVGFSTRGGPSWTIEFLDTAVSPIGTATGTAADTEAPELTASGITFTAPVGAAAVELTFTATGRSVLVDLVSVRVAT